MRLKKSLNKKKGMIDIRALHKKGIIKIPKGDGGLEPNADGFVEIDSAGEIMQPRMVGRELSVSVKTPVSSGNAVASSLVSEAQSSGGDSGGFFNFFDAGSASNSSSCSSGSFSTEGDGYSKREVDAKIESLDNKLYRLEQRIELLERKAGVDGGW